MILGNAAAGGKHVEAIHGSCMPPDGTELGLLGLLLLLVQELYGNMPRVRTPRIYWQATRRRVLTMEWIDGVKLTNKVGGGPLPCCCCCWFSSHSSVVSGSISPALSVAVGRCPPWWWTVPSVP
jgi:hypothetical protein